jgi:upstream activation factor subunit UAF30
MGGIGGGGLSGLISQFEGVGLVHIAQSWVGNGPNQRVSPQQRGRPTGGLCAHSKRKAANRKTAPPKGAKVRQPKPGGRANAIQQPLQPSSELVAIVGEGRMARREVVSKVWEYIKAHKLQNAADGREIIADERLHRIFGKDRATMFEMNKFLAQHLK